MESFELDTLVSSLPLPVPANDVGHQDSNHKSGKRHAHSDGDDVVRFVVTVHWGLQTIHFKAKNVSIKVSAIIGRLMIGGRGRGVNF